MWLWMAHLVLRGMPILKHCSWISAMQARGLEVVEGGAMSVVVLAIDVTHLSSKKVTVSILQPRYKMI
jgi:hypothetical protein